MHGRQGRHSSEEELGDCHHSRFTAHRLPARPPPRPPRPAACLRLPPLRCRCQLIQGTPALQARGGYGEHVWVTKEELPEYIQQPELLGLLQKML